MQIYTRLVELTITHLEHAASLLSPALSEKSGNPASLGALGESTQHPPDLMLGVLGRGDSHNREQQRSHAVREKQPKGPQPKQGQQRAGLGQRVRGELIGLSWSISPLSQCTRR